MIPVRSPSATTAASTLSNRSSCVTHASTSTRCPWADGPPVSSTPPIQNPPSWFPCPRWRATDIPAGSGTGTRRWCAMTVKGTTYRRPLVILKVCCRSFLKKVTFYKRMALQLDKRIKQTSLMMYVFKCFCENPLKSRSTLLYFFCPLSDKPCWKVDSYLPMPGGLQCRILTN